MNRKSAGILLCIATVALWAAVMCRPSFQPAAERAAVRTPATQSLPASESAWIPATAEVQATVGSPAAMPATRTPETSVPAAQAPVQDDDAGLPPGAKVDRATIVKLHGDQPLTVDHPHVKPAIEVQERNSKWLMALPGVTGTAVGLNDDGAIALVVYTKADTTEIPKVIDGLPVVTWNTGQITSRNGAKAVAKPEAKSSGGRPQTKPVYQTQIRPLVPIGVSTSLTGSLTPGYWTAGTLGCRVKSVSTGATYALSNYHVYTFDGTVTIGGAVLQPGTLDSQGSITDGSDYLGNVTAVAAPDFTSGAENEVDAAIASTSILGVSTFAGGYGTPSSTMSSAALNTDVQKCGRTTGYTQGVISSINAKISVQYDEGIATFVHQVGISKPTRRSPSFSDSGDSGSLIVITGNNSPVSLLFAGSTNSTFGNPIGPVLTKFGVTVDDGK